MTKEIAYVPKRYEESGWKGSFEPIENTPTSSWFRSQFTSGHEPLWPKWKQWFAEHIAPYMPWFH